MRTSEKIDAILPAMLKAKASFPAIHRTADNPFFKSKYAALPDILTAIEPHLQANELILTSTAETNGSCAWLDTTLYHAPSGQWMNYSYPLNPVKNDPQGMGSATTYAQRYTLNALFWIAPDFDDDGNDASGRNAAPPTASKPKAKPGPDPNIKEREQLEAALESPTANPAKVAQVKAKIKAQVEDGGQPLSLGQIQQMIKYLGEA